MDKEKNQQTADDGKLHITKSIFQTSKEARQKAAEEEQEKQAEIERKLAERRRKADEARDKRLEEERRELIRLKQGVIDESDTIHEEAEKEVKQNIFQKISSFFYLNKWWLGLGSFFVLLAGFLVYNYISKPRPDMEVVVIGENYMLGYDSTIEDYLSSFADDFNGNGKVYAMMNYIPYTGDDQKDYTGGVQTKMTAVLQSDEAVIIIGNQLCADIMSDGTFTDLTAFYPDNEHINGDKFMLSGTDFAQKIGIDSKEITDDWFIAIRNPRKLAFTNKERMQEVYDRDFAVFDAIIKDLS